MKIENIKFKAKRLDNGEWVEGNLRTSKSGNAMIIPIEYRGAYPVETTTVCQFTGLKDSEGKEVWDHDLLQSQGTGISYEVSYSQEEGGFIVKESVCGARLLTFLCAVLTLFKFKVIGNKFDNK